jgi:muramoyltetrapeptide carboxypeptidase
MADRSLLKPKCLKPGDRVGVVVPSSPFDRETFERGISRIEAMGFSTVLAEGLFDQDGYLAGTDERRADQLHRFFEDPAIDGIICARGGYGSLRLLALLDFGLIRRNPKVFVGFSDASALLASFYQRSGLACFHGPMVTALATGEAETAAALLAALTGTEKISRRSESGETIRPGAAAGPVCGGNLTVLCHMLGTPFAPRFSGHILFLEDIGEAPYRIDRMLTQMRLAGVFQGVRAVVLGTFKDCGKPAEISRIVEQAFSEERIPILAGIAAGHGKRNLTIPIGPVAKLDADKGLLEYQEAATVERQ